MSNSIVDDAKAKPGLEATHLTDVGRQRENNEDSYLYWEPDSEEEFQRKGRLAVIADGMGGHEGGQEASRLAVETVRSVYDQNFAGDPQQTLAQAFTTANDRIRGQAAANPALHGMGTTCTALAILGRQLFFAHTGDSRLYLVRTSSITRLTRDHSYVSKLVESGIVAPEDAEMHPQRHILTAALGTGREVTIDAPPQAIALEENDALVLCTDGLWSQVKEQEIADAVCSNPPAEACLVLVNIALQRGGPDNITVQILKVVA